MEYIHVHAFCNTYMYMYTQSLLHHAHFQSPGEEKGNMKCNRKLMGIDSKNVGVMVAVLVDTAVLNKLYSN